MPRVTLDIDDKFDQTLTALSDGSGKADVIRRAVASYQLLHSALAESAPGTRLALTDAAGHIEKTVVLPASGANTQAAVPATGAAAPVIAEEHVIGKRAIGPSSAHVDSVTVDGPESPGLHLGERSRPEVVTISPGSVGSVQIAPPSFLERWGVIFLAAFSLWIIAAGSIILFFYLSHQPPAPNLSGLSPDGLRDALSAHKQLEDQWRDSLENVFDLLITKTALPLVTLLLGYLFGKGQGGSN